MYLIKIGHTLFCRTRRQGDVIPLRRGRKKIKELFIDAKIPRAERERYPLFVAGDTVIWVPRLKEAFGADEQTDRKVWIQIRRVQE
jgi:tRNA(Ile)-lysidine synthase